MPKIQSAQTWVKILNEVLAALRERVDESGNGVFRLPEVTEPLGYKSQTTTISRHLQNLRLLQPVQKQADGRYLWRVSLTKKRITQADIKKSREKEAARKLASSTKPPKRVPRKPTTAKKDAGSKAKQPPKPPATPPASNYGEPPRPPRGDEPVSSVTTVPTVQALRHNEQRTALLGIIKELEDDVSRLKDRIDDLKRENAALRGENSALSEQLEAVSNSDLDREVIDVISRYR